MDGPLSFFDSIVQDVRGDGTEMFGSQDMKCNGNDSQYAPSNADPDDPFLDAPLVVSQPLDPAIMDSNPTKTTRRTVNTRARTRSRLAASHSNSATEPPGLTSESSETSETRSTQQTTTPEDAPSYPEKSKTAPKISNPAQAKPPNKKRRQQKQEDEEEEEEADDDDLEVDSTKRNKFLERNRVAATKCRQKKREWVSDLEETRFGLESQHNRLQIEYSSLKSQITQIKSELMEHANCNDSNINTWIENEAKRFVLGASERYDQMLANMGHTPGLINRQRSMSFTSGYPAITDPELLSPVTPAHRSSISFPSGPLMPNSPVFYRPSLTTNVPGAANVAFNEEAYTTEQMPTSMAEDIAGFDDMSMVKETFQGPAISEG
ncbi:hypothetical protein M426DRAFT_8389 [Hypoxylon sp. CI-4A]|nr:hypothetical protein M426DRAFT_8389 [Hypoxylon sp. CI-4A]